MLKLKKLLMNGCVALLSVALLLPAFSRSAHADTTVAQSGPNPIVIDPTLPIDNVTVLMAAASEHNSGLTVPNYGQPKHSWLSGFNDNVNDYLRWQVTVPAAANYHVQALLSSGTAVPLKLRVVGTAYELNFTTNNIGWDKLDAGVIFLPAGTSTLELVRNTSSYSSMDIKSLELVRESDWSGYQTRINQFKKDTTWLSEANYGLMFQYGPWGYPQSGTKKSMEQQTNDFNVPAFVQMVKDTGANYVIWSASWWTYQISSPIASIDSIVGNGDRTTTRDLIGEIAEALHDEGIRFMLYYHTGQDSHLGYNSTNWWQEQQWPSTFTSTGTGDRSVFFDNWMNVISEMGIRYGTNLDGWFFDDGLVYYPAPFEAMGQAARAGNPNRLLSYNSWIAARYTDFQDVYFAEGSHGEVQYGSAPAGSNGVFVSGAQQGLLQQAMFVMEQDWGVSAANQPITTGITQHQALTWLQDAVPRNVPLTFNMMMWEDGTVSSTSLNILKNVKKALYETDNGVMNDTHVALTYSGDWNYSTSRGVGDHGDDVHYTRTNGSYMEYTFTGTGIQVLSEKYSDQGNVDVYIDGIFDQTINTYNSSRLVKQIVYSKGGLSPGTHTIKLVKTSGTFMLIDGLQVPQSTSMINDSSSAIVYSSVGYSANRGAGDYQDDVHYLTANGSSIEYSFTGTGIEWIGPTTFNNGNAEVYIDGLLQSTVSGYSASYTPQQVLYQKSGLAYGSHTIRIVKQSGTYVQLDAFRVTG